LQGEIAEQACSSDKRPVDAANVTRNAAKTLSLKWKDYMAEIRREA